MPCATRLSSLLRQRRHQRIVNAFTKGHARHGKKASRKKGTSVRSRRAPDDRTTLASQMGAPIQEAPFPQFPFQYQAQAQDAPPMAYFNPYVQAYSYPPINAPFDQSLNRSPSLVPPVQAHPYPFVQPTFVSGGIPGTHCDDSARLQPATFPFSFEYPYRAVQPSVRLSTPALSLMDDSSNMSTTPTPGGAFRPFTCDAGPSTCQPGLSLREPGPSNQTVREDKGKGRAVESDTGSLTPRPFVNGDAPTMENRIFAVRSAAQGLYEALDGFMFSLNNM